MKQKLFVIKVGGNVIEDESKLLVFLRAFHQLEGKKLLIHGGGKLATNVAERLGEEVKMVDGRRITDRAMIDIVTMVYGGLVNKNLVAKLQAMGCNAMGLTGADGDLITSHQRPVKDGIDYGYVGDPYRVNAAMLTDLLHQNLVPVVAPLTHNGLGDMLNTNADTMASVLAKSMSDTFEVSLVYAFELKGVMRDIADDSTLIRHINSTIFQQLKADGTIHSGMLPKLSNALEAVGDGVANVTICHFQSIGALSDSSFDGCTKIVA